MYIDLTHTFNNNMPVFPGDASADLVKVASVEKDGVSAYTIKTSMHVGTHMDAPSHMLTGGKSLNEYPLEKFFGRGLVIDARGKASAGSELLEGADVKKGDIVLVCFDWSTEFGKDDYYHNYPEISEGFAEKLCDAGASIVGMDTPSPDRAPYKTHKILLKSDILIIENLTNLAKLMEHKNFEIIALPAKFEAEASPCRVVAKV